MPDDREGIARCLLVGRNREQARRLVDRDDVVVGNGSGDGSGKDRVNSTGTATPARILMVTSPILIALALTLSIGVLVIASWIGRPAAVDSLSPFHYKDRTLWREKEQWERVTRSQCCQVMVRVRKW